MGRATCELVQFRPHVVRGAPVRVLAAVLALLLAACGEPPVDLDLPVREPGQVVFDEAGILDPGVAERLAQLQRDVVALTYETEQASAGEARRAGQLLVDRWDADIALVAVAQPGDFTSGAEDRERFFGIEPADTFAVPGGLREEIAEQIIPPVAETNDWTTVFLTAAEALEEGLRGR